MREPFTRGIGPGRMPALRPGQVSALSPRSPFDFARVTRETFLPAMIAIYDGVDRPLAVEPERLLI